MALRRTADRVDAQMRTYRRDHSIHSTWPVAERLMVSIGPSPFSAKLIRSAKRLAERLSAEWIVAFVETPRHAGAPPEIRQRGPWKIERKGDEARLRLNYRRALAREGFCVVGAEASLFTPEERRQST